MEFVRLAPKVADLQTGDLIWPRADHQFVKFDEPPAEWQQAYDLLITEPATLSPAQRALLNAHARRLWVGHVAFIDIVGGRPWVVDATPQRSLWNDATDKGNPKGVGSQPYENFLNDKDHFRSHIWHGRVKSHFVSHIPNFGQDLINAAKKHLGADYTFFPQGLENPDKFYCSKFIWHAMRDGLDITLEKKPDAPSYSLWFTPWDVMQADCIELLYEPPNRQYVE